MLNEILNLHVTQTQTLGQLLTVGFLTTVLGSLVVSRSFGHAELTLLTSRALAFFSSLVGPRLLSPMNCSPRPYTASPGTRSKFSVAMGRLSVPVRAIPVL